MKYTQDEIKLMDNLFVSKFENKKGFTNSFFAEKFNVSEKIIEHFEKQICKFPYEFEDTVFFEEKNSGNCYIVRFDDYLAKKFIDSGSFKAYFENLYNDENQKGVFINNQTIHNSGNIGNISQAKNIKDINSTQKYFVEKETFLISFIVDIIVGIIVGLILNYFS